MTADDIYNDVTERVLSALDKGTVPWRRPWTVAGMEAGHHNPLSGTAYRGVNPVLLELSAMTSGYTDPRWVTFKQAREAGGSVRRGEKSTPVVFWKRVAKRDPATGEAMTDDKGRPVTLPMLRQYRVFNAEQVSGLDLEPITPPQREEPARIEACEHIVRAMPKRPPIRYGGARAFYVPALDYVQLPPRAAFDTPEGFYATVFHELGHSTGHRTRLDRDGIEAVAAFGTATYSREELVAELCAAMVGAVAGIAPATIENTAAYCRGWASKLRDDRKAVVLAAARAQRAADWILDRHASE